MGCLAIGGPRGMPTSRSCCNWTCATSAPESTGAPSSSTVVPTRAWSMNFRIAGPTSPTFRQMGERRQCCSFCRLCYSSMSLCLCTTPQPGACHCKPTLAVGLLCQEHSLQKRPERVKLGTEVGAVGPPRTSLVLGATISSAPMLWGSAC